VAQQCFLPILILIDRVQHRRLDDAVIEESAVAAAVAGADPGDTDDPSNRVLVHGIQQVLRSI